MHAWLSRFGDRDADDFEGQPHAKVLRGPFQMVNLDGGDGGAVAIVVVVVVVMVVVVAMGVVVVEGVQRKGIAVAAGDKSKIFKIGQW